MWSDPASVFAVESDKPSLGVRATTFNEGIAFRNTLLSKSDTEQPRSMAYRLISLARLAGMYALTTTRFSSASPIGITARLGRKPGCSLASEVERDFAISPFIGVADKNLNRNALSPNAHWRPGDRDLTKSCPTAIGLSGRPASR